MEPPYDTPKHVHTDSLSEHDRRFQGSNSIASDTVISLEMVGELTREERIVGSTVNGITMLTTCLQVAYCQGQGCESGGHSLLSELL